MKISAKQYAKLIIETTGKAEDDKKATRIIEKVGELIKKNKDERKIYEIVKEINKLEKEDKNFVEVLIQSSGELSNETIEEIKKKVAEKKDTPEEKVKISSEVNPKLKGGLVVKIGNEIIDGSVQNRIKYLKRELVS